VGSDGVGERVKQRLRAAYRSAFETSPTLRMLYYLMKVPSAKRTTTFVDASYSQEWSEFCEILDRTSSVDDWISIPGFDDAPATYIHNGRKTYGRFDANRVWMDEVEKTIRQSFPEARSITEYGCGVGRNVIDLKLRFPSMACYGYELSQAGVDVARAAAKKFGQDVAYAQLDYVKGTAADFVHPPTDLALTVFSLEQIPHASVLAVKNMLDHTNLGSIHMEPVCENYPLSYGGILGRLYTWRVDYLQNFDDGVRALPVADVSYRVLDTSANPLEPRPSLYTLRR
jgi:SAM-dependent methyltransferase